MKKDRSFTAREGFRHLSGRINRLTALLCAAAILAAMGLLGGGMLPVSAKQVKWYYGDINRDGKIDSTDARMVLQFEVKLITLTASQQTLADVNRDGKIDSTDARMILQYEVGLIKSF